MKVSRHLALPLLAVAIGIGVYLSLDLQEPPQPVPHSTCSKRLGYGGLRGS